MATLDSPDPARRRPPPLPLGSRRVYAPCLAGFLRQGDAIGLALPDDGPFKLGERPQDPEHEGGPRIGRVLREGQALLDKVHGEPFVGDLVNDRTQVHRGPGEPVNRRHDQLAVISQVVDSALQA